MITLFVVIEINIYSIYESHLQTKLQNYIDLNSRGKLNNLTSNHDIASYSCWMQHKTSSLNSGA